MEFWRGTGQGLLEHNRAYLAWIDQVLNEYPELVLENCGSGGGRMDYAQLSRFQIQSVTDQEDYLKLPAILVGSSAAVLPEQLAVWSYPTAESDVERTSFNMVTAMMCRIHQSGRLDKLSTDAFRQVVAGLDQYKKTLRKHLPEAVPFYPLSMPDVTDAESPIALGMRAPGLTWLAVWRVSGASNVQIPWATKSPRILYPTDLGISLEHENDQLVIKFPQTKMACLISG
jgi:alpha-galactosidase